MASGCFSAHMAVRLVASGIYLFRDIPIQRAAFIGVDIKKIQPDLAHSGQPDLSSRIKWVHTNLYGSFVLLTLVHMF